MIERRRTQLRREALDRLDADLDEPHERLEAIDGVRRDVLARHRLRGSPELELDGRQRLPELVVQLARQRRPLVFARRLHARRELPQLFL